MDGGSPQRFIDRPAGEVYEALCSPPDVTPVREIDPTDGMIDSATGSVETPAPTAGKSVENDENYQAAWTTELRQ